MSLSLYYFVNDHYLRPLKEFYYFFSVNESPRVNRAAPSNTMSFSRNPPEPESAGKPPRLFSHPGKENRKVSVAKNVHTASTLPMADSFAERGRIAINTAAVISAEPMMFEVD